MTPGGETKDGPRGGKKKKKLHFNLNRWNSFDAFYEIRNPVDFLLR